MVQFTVSGAVDIGASLERVWIAFRNGSLVRHANDRVTTAEVLEGDGYALGSRWREVRIQHNGPQKGLEMVSVQEVVENHPMIWYETRGTYEVGGAVSHSRVNFTSLGRTTHVDVTVEVEMAVPPLPWFVAMWGTRAATRLLRSSTREALAYDLYAWKEFIEANGDLRQPK